MHNKPKRTIVVEPYNPKWKEEFFKIKSMLLPHISDLIIDIVHIGSTSVEGLAAKPIIDFNIIIDSYEVFPILDVFGNSKIQKMVNKNTINMTKYNQL